MCIFLERKDVKGISSGCLCAFLFLLSGNVRVFRNKYEDAAQLFIKAGNTYKLGKSWKKAGEAFVRAAECYAQTSSGKYDAAVKYSDAAKAFKNGYPAEAISASESSIELYENLGRFQQCARLMKVNVYFLSLQLKVLSLLRSAFDVAVPNLDLFVEQDLAEIHEANGETEKAIAAYSRAADFYDGEDAKANANTCRIKVQIPSIPTRNQVREICWSRTQMCQQSTFCS